MVKKFLLVAVILIGVVFAVHAVLSYRTYNVILITVDTLRQDYLSCYDPKIPSTPNIDGLARDGVLFRHAYCLVPITLASHTCILTSRMPHETGVFNNGDIFDHKIPMVSDLLEEKGYQTAAFVSLGVLKGEFGLASGFNEYSDKFDQVHGRYYKYAREVNEEVLPWLEKTRKRKFFLWIHYSDPHEPYAPENSPDDTEVLVNGESYRTYPLAKKEKYAICFEARPGVNRVEFRALAGDVPKKFELNRSMRFLDQRVVVDPDGSVQLVFGNDWKDIRLNTGLPARFFARTATMQVVNPSSKPQRVSLTFSGGVIGQRLIDSRANYLGEVHAVDEQVGVLRRKLESLGLKDRTIIVLTADHGEGLKTHGIMGHVDRLWYEIMDVPLIVYYPTLGRRGFVSNAFTNHLDIMPTIMDLVHVRKKVPMDGFSLKHYVSRSPVDWLFSSPVRRTRTFAATYAPEARVDSFALTDGKVKLIHSPMREKWKWEAYDVIKDPAERKNLVTVDPKRFEGSEIHSMRHALELFRTQAEAAHETWRAPTLGEEQREMLRKLGYVSE